MGVINKLKGRMSGYNALTRGPASMNEDYAASTGFDDFGFKSGYKSKTSGVNAVSAGLSAGAAQQAPVEEDFGAKLAETGANIGMAIADSGMLDNVGNKRRKSIKASKEAGMTGKEARQKYRAERKEERASKKAERVANREKKKGAKKIKKYLKDNPLTFRI